MGRTLPIATDNSGGVVRAETRFSTGFADVK